MSWAELAGGGVHVQTVPGCHSNLFVEPFVHALAQALQARLETQPAVEGRYAMPVRDRGL
jgi:hypothetical protein